MNYMWACAGYEVPTCHELPTCWRWSTCTYRSWTTHVLKIKYMYLHVLNYPCAGDEVNVPTCLELLTYTCMLWSTPWTTHMYRLRSMCHELPTCALTELPASKEVPIWTWQTSYMYMHILWATCIHIYMSWITYMCTYYELSICSHLKRSKENVNLDSEQFQFSQLKPVEWVPVERDCN